MIEIINGWMEKLMDISNSRFAFATEKFFRESDTISIMLKFALLCKIYLIIIIIIIIIVSNFSEKE